MPIIQDPTTGEWRWDYENGPMPNDVAPFDPATGQPLSAPAGASWDAGTGGWSGGGAPSEKPNPLSSHYGTAAGVDAPRGNIDDPAPPPPSGFNYDGGGAGSPSTFEVSSSWPTLSLPRFDPGPGFAAPPPFSYDNFQAPTLEQAKQNPGYEFSRQEGIGALQNSAAARGVLRTGGTLKDILGWGNKFAEQNYSNVFNRDLTTYGTNRNNAESNYMTNYGVSRDVFDRNYGQRKDKFSYDTNAQIQEFLPRERAATATFDDLFRRWREQVASLTNIATAGAGA